MKQFIIDDKIMIKELDTALNHRYKDVFDFKIIWNYKEMSSICIDQKKVEFGKDDFLILMPEYQINLDEFVNDGTRIFSFSVDYLQLEAKSFSIDLFKLFIKNSGQLQLKVETEDVKQIEKLFEMIIHLDADTSVNQQIGVHLANVILLILIRNNHELVSNPDKNFTRIHDFFLLVFKYSKTEKRVTFYADQLFISPKRLNQILQMYTGRSASYFIQEHIVMQAKHLLQRSEQNITEIAQNLGFQDVAYFSRFFKKWMKLSPEKFRKKE